MLPAQSTQRARPAHLPLARCAGLRSHSQHGVKSRTVLYRRPRCALGMPSLVADILYSLFMYRRALESGRSRGASLCQPRGPRSCSTSSSGGRRAWAGAAPWGSCSTALSWLAASSGAPKNPGVSAEPPRERAEHWEPAESQSKQQYKQTQILQVLSMLLRAADEKKKFKKKKISPPLKYSRKNRSA